MQPVSKQRIEKHASTKIELLLETLIAIRFMQSGYKENNWGNQLVESWAVQGAEKRWR
jgi:hypothetical protein